MGQDDEEDELQLALALSASLALHTERSPGAQQQALSPPRPRLPAPPPPPPPPPPRPPPPPPPPRLDACAACRRAFAPGSRFFQALGRAWHPQCFVCAACQQPFEDGTFIVHHGGDDALNAAPTTTTPAGPSPYHPRCHRTLFSPVCCVCGDSVPEKPGGGGCEWREHPFWRAEQRYCPRHGRGSPGGGDGTPSCSACGRLRPSRREQEEWTRLSDGRLLCGDCAETVVVDTRDAQPLYTEVLAFLERVLRSGGGGDCGSSSAAAAPAFPYKPPLYLVDGPTMHAHALREGRGGGRGSNGGGGNGDEDDEDDEDDGDGGAPIFHTRGLCLCTVTTTTTVVQGPPASLAELLGGLFRGGGGSGSSALARSRPQPQPHHHQTCDVHALLVLEGLPRALAGAVLAHECLHAFLRMRGVAGAFLPLEVEEGLCQLAALLWLESPAGAEGCERGWPARLRAYGAHQIREHTSQIYGGGFRSALDLFQRKGAAADNGGLRLLVDACVARRGWPEGY